MYEPRRVLGPTAMVEMSHPRFAEDAGSTGSSGRPKRAALTWKDTVAHRAGGTLVVLAASATAGSLILSGDAAAAAVAVQAPDRALNAVSRTADRTVVADELTSSTLSDATASVVGVTRLYTKGTLNVRKAADEDSKLLGSIPEGAKVTATTEVSGKYRKVEFKDGTGWVLAKHLSKKAARSGRRHHHGTLPARVRG